MKIRNVLALVCLAPAAWAGLIGTSVTGSMTVNGGPTNYFNPANGFVPAGPLNNSGTTVVVTNAAIEFGASAFNNTITADFSDTQLTLSEAAFTVNDPSFAIQLTGAAFNSVTLASSSFNGMTYSLAGGVLTINVPAAVVLTSLPRVNGAQPPTAVFNISAVPEPSTLAFAGLGLMALAAARRRV